MSRIYTALKREVHTPAFLFHAMKNRLMPVETAHDVYCSGCGVLTHCRSKDKAEGGAPDIASAGVRPMFVSAFQIDSECPELVFETSQEIPKRESHLAVLLTIRSLITCFVSMASAPSAKMGMARGGWEVGSTRKATGHWQTYFQEIVRILSPMIHGLLSVLKRASISVATMLCFNFLSYLVLPAIQEQSGSVRSRSPRRVRYRTCATILLPFWQSMIIRGGRNLSSAIGGRQR